MKRNLLIAALVVSFMFGTATTEGQKRWTLDECISYALRHNLEIESKSITNEAGKELYAQSRRNLLPSVGAGSGYSINYGKSVDPNTNAVTTNNFASNSYNLQGSLMLFEGFARNNLIAYNRYKHLAGIEQEKALKIDIAFAVMNSYLNSLYYKGLLEIVREQKELSELNLEKIRKQSQIGISARTEILEIEARLAEEELQVIRTQNYLRSSVLELKRVMNYPAGEEIQLQEPEEIGLMMPAGTVSADSVYQMALEHLPSVQARVQQLKSVERSLAVSKGYLLPSLYLYGGFNTGFYETHTDDTGNIIPFSSQLRNNASQAIGLSLNIPLFNKWNTRSEVRLGRLQLEREKVELKNYRNQLYYEIEGYCQELMAMAAEFAQAQKQTESNLLAFEVAQKKKDQGLFNIIDLYSSKNLLSNARSELLRARLQYLLKRKTIDFYMGKPVFGPEIHHEI